MAKYKSLVFAFVILQCFNCNHGQLMGNSAGQAIGGITKAFTSVVRNATAIKEILDMFQSPGDFMTKIGGSDQGKALLQRLQKQEVTIGVECLQHVGMMLQALARRDEWALRMLDAMGKPPAGLMSKMLWPGDWEECITTQAVVNHTGSGQTHTTHPFTGKYCNVNFPLGTGLIGKLQFTIGACLPDTCSSSDATTMIQTLYGMLPNNTSMTIPEPEVTCQEKHIPLDGQAIAVIIVCSIFVAAMTLATLYDVIYVQWLAKRTSTRAISYQNGGFSEDVVKNLEVSVVEKDHVSETQQNGVENGLPMKSMAESKTYEPPSAGVTKYKPSPLEGILLSFSVFTNGTKILNTRQPKGALTAVNGIRFISMTWVIVGHGFGMLGYIGETDNYYQYSSSLMKRREFFAIVNGTFSVDTFFVLSGLLVSYLTLKEIEKRKGVKKFNWAMYYFHRIWRLTPPYMLLLMVWVSLGKYFANGTMWHQDGYDKTTCEKTWWTNLLYINNLVDKEDRDCFGVTWYLANDMQFYIIAPLALIPLYLSPIFGGLACLALLLVSTISSGMISWHYKMLTPTAFRGQAPEYSWLYYQKPWCRVGPYAIGLFTGYLLNRYKLKLKINRTLNVVLWLVSIALGLLIVYGLYTPDMTSPLSVKMSALYNATARSVWGACVAWVIFSCANGYGGPVNHILSWPGFVPLGRLTYFAYLAHPLLQVIYHGSQMSTSTMYDYAAVYVILGDLCMAYAAAFVLSLGFEAPMMGLEKVLLGRGKNS